MGIELQKNTGHSEWVDGRSHQSGFTSTFGPNTKAPCEQSGQVFDVDWTSQREGASQTTPTYAAITARSSHSGGVTVGLMDGSARFATDATQLALWQALSTRNGAEPVSPLAE